MAAIYVQDIALVTAPTDADLPNVLRLEMWKIKVQEFQAKDLFGIPV